MLISSVAGWAQLPCGVANQITCQPWDGGSNLYASQNDTGSNGFGNFATTYGEFTLPSSAPDWDVESFHWVGGYFNPAVQGPITAWTLTLYDNAGGAPGSEIAAGYFPGTGDETFLGDVNGYPIYDYSLYFQSFDMNSGTYWASVVPDIAFPPQWGWATGVGPDGGYQCYFGTCGALSSGMAFAVDGTPTVPEPGTLAMLGIGLLCLLPLGLRRRINVA